MAPLDCSGEDRSCGVGLLSWVLCLPVLIGQDPEAAGVRWNRRVGGLGRSALRPKVNIKRPIGASRCGHLSEGG